MPDVILCVNIHKSCLEHCLPWQNGSLRDRALQQFNAVREIEKASLVVTWALPNLDLDAVETSGQLWPRGSLKRKKSPKMYVPMGSQNQRSMVYFENAETYLPQALGNATLHAKPGSSTAFFLLHD